ncbi:hypothetical protein EKG37_21730 [Robertmurraya yapensis]|uniref:Uncharacterized protein n=1 Tax=Bacillus yapensis TaxID=2492960 RepID=A0A3S0KAF0_9BACI|nr:hypothetical protein [Bacillus yapensis]RTR26294.1 hypothetical protein EKG37_21730 [Bacillus yapensis]TKS93649.1 hypothetical protein FAR12_21735 [Bacillus yapensis]
MDTQEFMSLSALEKVELVNKMLKEEEDCHLKNTASKLGLSESTFSKVMRDNSSYQYNKTSKQYDRIMPIEEYKKYLQSGSDENKMEETLQFVAEHLEELKGLLHANETQLVLEPEIYDSSSTSITRTIQVNEDIFKSFYDLYSSRFSHIRLREIYSKCLLDFIKAYQPKKTPEN